MPQIINIYPAVSAPIGDLVTYRALPTQYIDYVDPFLFLNHHGPQVYKPHNRGLPFGPHPHRGMETVTFIIDGDISHKDSSGHESVMTAGGVQWMRAGRGVIHSEVSSADFKANGGPMEILQLWVNLPARLKMSDPFYFGKQKDEIPAITLDEGRVEVDVIFGEWDGNKPAFESDLGIQINTIKFKADGKLTLNIPEGHNVFFYVIRGELIVNATTVKALNLATFDQDGGELTVSASIESILLFGHAKPYNEPVVSQGPFVMNTEEEIMQAYKDYQQGKFGSWNF
jgi:redox-sensitive bicupin YhaK (pirin superfamily)